MKLASCWSCVIISNGGATCLLLELCYNRDRGAISSCKGGRTYKGKSISILMLFFPKCLVQHPLACCLTLKSISMFPSFTWMSVRVIYEWNPWYYLEVSETCQP